MLRMCGHLSACFFHCDVLLLQDKRNGFRHLAASVRSEFIEQVANFDCTSKSVKYDHACLA